MSEFKISWDDIKYIFTVLVILWPWLLIAICGVAYLIFDVYILGAPWTVSEVMMLYVWPMVALPLSVMFGWIDFK